LAKSDFEHWETKVKFYWIDEKTKVNFEFKMIRELRFGGKENIAPWKVWFRVWVWWKKSASRINQNRVKDSIKWGDNWRCRGKTSWY